MVHPCLRLTPSSIQKKIRSSSIKKNIVVVFHNSSSWAKIRLHTENQLHGLPGSALKVSVGGGGVGQPITLSIPTRVEVELFWHQNMLVWGLVERPFCNIFSK